MIFSPFLLVAVLIDSDPPLPQEEGSREMGVR